jgi:hypothetical protein
MNGTAHLIRSISNSALLLLAISAHAATVWNGPTISFTKSNYANPLLAENQDRLTANVWITRASSQGLFNANTESRFTHFLSPAGTEWANGSLENYATLSYTNWNHWARGVNLNPYATVGVQAVLHLIAEDIYLSVQFTSWTGGAPGGGPSYGGGFSYLRSTPVGQRTTNTWTGADPSGYWSAPANWSPAGVPVNGNDLVFPGGLPPGDMVSTNDLTNRSFRSITFGGASRHTIRGNPITLTNRADCIINSGTNVIACDLTFSGTPATPPTPQFGTFTIRGSFNSELTVIGNVGGGSLIPAIRRLVIRGQFTGGSIRQWVGDLALYGDNPYAVAAEVKNGTLFVQGSQPNLNITMLWEFESAACPNLSGDGVVGDVMGCGHFILDSTLSVKNLVPVTGFWRVLDIRLNGTNVGEYGRLIVSGDVNLSGGSLLPSAGFNPQAGQIYTIVEKTSPGVIPNEFLGPEGTVTTLNGMPFRISYTGGDGNDVTLTTLTAPDAPPTVTITNPPNGAVFEPPASFTLGAAAADPGGSVTNVQFFLDATSLGNDTSSPYSVPVSGLVVGNYTLTAVASDDAGTHATNLIAITVQTRPEWDVSQDFSLAANPGGPWSYGYMNVLGGAFSLLTYSQYSPDNNGLMIFAWSKNGFEPVSVYKNQTSQTSISDGGYGTYPPGTVWFQGGVEGHVDNYGVIRFTVPADKAGTYRVETAVRTYLDGPTSRDADFWVLKNRMEVFSHFLGPNSGTGYTNIFTLAAGDTIDFVCGRGQDNMIDGSGLKIRATLTRTPVPIVLGAVQRSGTQFVFSYSADVGLRYAVERSATLSNWTTIWSNTANFNPMTVTDTAATNWMNFYRVRRLPSP